MCDIHMCTFCKVNKGTNLNKNISGKFLTLILETKTINLNKFFNNMIFNTLQPQLCLVQAAIFPGIQTRRMKVNILAMLVHRFIDLQVCRFTDSL